MSTRCPHANVTAVDHKPLCKDKRTVWQCQDCGNTWPDDPRHLAAANDGLADRLQTAIAASGGDPATPAELTMLEQIHRRARDLLEVSLISTAGADLDLDSFDAGIQYGAAATLQVLADHGIIRDDNGSST